MNFIKDDRAQFAGIFLFVFGIFIIAFIYILLGGLEGLYVTQNNNLISNPTYAYSQEHKDAMSSLFSWWWGIPIVAVIYFVVWAIKNALMAKSQEVY